MLGIDVCMYVIIPMKKKILIWGDRGLLSTTGRDSLFGQVEQHVPRNGGGALADSGAVEEYDPPEHEGILANSGAVIQNEPRTHRGALTKSGAVKGLCTDLAKIFPFVYTLVAPASSAQGKGH